MLNNIGEILRHQGDYVGARNCLTEALQIGQSIGDRTNQGYILTNMGHTLVGLEQWAEATDAFRQALALREELGQSSLAMDALAGLAHVSLIQGDLDQAHARVEEVLRYKESNTLDGAEDPFRIYLTCYHVLRAVHDPRARIILEKAHHLLQEEAAKIADEEMRRSFLENVAVHREIITMWEDS